MEHANHGTWFDCHYPKCGWTFVTQHLLSEHNMKLHGGQQSPSPQPQQAQPAAAQQSHVNNWQRGPQYQATPGYQNHQGNGRSFAHMAAAAAANPNPMAPQFTGPQIQKAKLREGDELTGASKKTYDAIVKTFIEDPTRGELQFPSTLTSQERHHVHKLCMHYQLDHQSTGAGATRQLRIWKPNFTAAVSSADGAGEMDANEAMFGAKFDGFMGCQPLNDEYFADHAADVAALVKEPAETMQRTMMSHLEHVAAATAQRKAQRKSNGEDHVWSTGKPPPVDPNVQQKGQDLQQFRHRLPSYKMKDDIVDAVRNHPVTVLSGDTGCGKTTQVPQLLYDAGIGREHGHGGGMIICTQPRRVSAISVAQRVAEERGQKCGGLVGYSIRFENVASTATRILYVTTGILLRRLHSDPDLNGVAVIVVDEVHERDVDTDFALLMLRDLIHRKRKHPLRLVVMSATIQVDKLVNYFRRPKPAPAPPLIAIPGALFDVKEYWLDDALEWLGVDPASVPSMARAIDVATAQAKQATQALQQSTATSSYDNLKTEALEKLDKAATEQTVPIELICGIIDLYHRQSPRQNAILVFLPGWAAIDKIMNMLRSKYGHLAREMSILPLHSTLTTAEQQRVFLPAPKNFRKIVLATNIAETSITIDDIVLVIDSCLHKGTSYDAVGNTSSLTSQLVAKANGKQRRGRAGRVQAGVCVHLLPKATYDALPDFLLPEMQRTALEEICLQVKAIVVDDDKCVDVLTKALDPPPTGSIEHAVTQLVAIGALDSKERLTSLGRVLATMPIHPALGKMLLLGASLGVFDPLCTLAAALSGKTPFMRPLPHQLQEARAAMNKFDNGKLSDHFAVLELFSQWSRAPRRNDFAYANWADHLSLLHIERMRAQLKRLLQQSGFIKKAQPGWESRYATNDALVRFALAHSLTPRIAVMERDYKNRHSNVFCWDNKPSNFHASSLVSRCKLRDVQGREFFVYFDRMRVESQLNLFDATAISRITMVLAAKTLHSMETASIPEAVRYDADRKFTAWDYDKADPALSAGTLVLDGGKKRFTARAEHTDTLVSVHDVVNFFFALTTHRMDATSMPDNAVLALAAALGEPARAIDTTNIAEEQAAAADVRLGPSAAAMAPNRDGDDDESSELPEHECVPEVDNGTDDEDDASPSQGKSVLTEAEADILIRAYGDLSWISRRTGGTAAKEYTEAPQQSRPSDSSATSPPSPSSPTDRQTTSVAVSTPTGTATAIDDEDDDEGDEIIAHPGSF
jgi:HrpA-like RNA helicase